MTATYRLFYEHSATYFYTARKVIKSLKKLEISFIILCQLVKHALQ